MYESQAGQDIFVDKLLNIDEGYFLDIGCSHYKNISNTYYLEKQRGWTGLLLDKSSADIEGCQEFRSSKSRCVNLIKHSIASVLKEENCPKLIDYISFDIDAATLHVLKDFPFDEYRFKIMTFEHDLWRRGKELREESRKIILSHGYKLLCADVSNQGNIYEDWYVDTNHVVGYEYLESTGWGWKKITNQLLLSN